MRRRPTKEQLQAAKLSYEEIGRSLAALVLEHGKTEAETWGTIADLGLYEHWEFMCWLDLHREARHEQITAFVRKEREVEELRKRVRQLRPATMLEALRNSEIG